MSKDCDSHCDKMLDLIDKRLTRIEDKLDSLESFKFKLIGISIAVSFILSLLLK